MTAERGVAPSTRSTTGVRVAGARWVNPWEPEVLQASGGVSPPSRRGWMFAAIWLVYLVPTLAAAWSLPSPAARAGGVVTVIVFAVAYVRAFFVIRGKVWIGGALPIRRQVTLLAGMLALTLLGCVLIGQPATAFCVYLSVLAVMVLPIRWALGAVALDMAAVEVAAQAVPGWSTDHGLTFSIFVSALAIWGITQMIARNQQLAGAREEIARLAVANERSRFARDLHDLLGHSLTVVTVKAELAGRLVAIDPERAEKEIADVERLARDALSDVRAAVAGYREVSLARELVAARAALDAAGISAQLPGAIDEVPGERRELFGWAVREGVTNVIRHSGAAHCEIALTPSAVEIRDDGVGPLPGSPATPQPGDGLLGLRERAAPLGASVTIETGEPGGFRLRVGW